MKKKSKQIWPPRKDTPENQEKAFNYSLKYLSFRARSTKEISDYLQRKNFLEDTINSALKRLTDLKFINDEEFARLWVESRQKHKGKSKFILKMELQQKGINSQTIETILSEAKNDIDTAREIFEKKKIKLIGLSSEVFKKKMATYLGGKGYSWDIILKLLKEE